MEQQVPPRKAERVIMTDHILPSQTNTYGTMFGGDVMAMMDKAAAIAALRFCRIPVVTASTERLDFRTPIQGGAIVEAHAHVIHTGRTSMIVRVDVYSETPLSGERELCTTGYFSMVAVGPEGRPTPIPQLLVETEQQQAEWRHGEEIKGEIQTRRRERR